QLDEVDAFAVAPRLDPAVGFHGRADGLLEEVPDVAAFFDHGYCLPRCCRSVRFGGGRRESCRGAEWRSPVCAQVPHSQQRPEGTLVAASLRPLRLARTDLAARSSLPRLSIAPQDAGAEIVLHARSAHDSDAHSADPDILSEQMWRRERS